MVEVVPFALEALVALSAFCALIVATGLLTAWGHSFGFLFQWLGKHARISTHLPYGVKHIDLGGPFRRVDHIVYTALQTWRDGAEIEFAWSLHKMAQTYEWTAQAIDYLTRETAETFDKLWHVGLPKWAKWAALSALPPALLAKIIAQAVAHAIPHIQAATRVVTHDVTHSVTRIVRSVVHTAVAFPPWVIRLPHRVGRVERDISKLTRRLHKVEAFAAAGVFAGLLANALGVSLRCVRRGNFKRAARRVCGMNTNLLESLLQDATLIVGTISIVELAEGLQRVMPAMTDAMGYFVEETGGSWRQPAELLEDALSVLPEVLV